MVGIFGFQYLAITNIVPMNILPPVFYGHMGAFQLSTSWEVYIYILIEV